MLDGLLLRFLTNEIKNKISNLYVDKVYHTSKEELVFHFRSSQNYRLLLSASSSHARFVLTEQAIENPPTPTMFCMLMRKYLCNAKLIDISQHELERIVFFDFQASNEIGDKINVRLIFEIMGRHSNIILVSSDGYIIDAIKRVGPSISRLRQVGPKIIYNLPPNLNKINILESDMENTLNSSDLAYQPDQLSKELISSFQGFSPIIAKEIIYRLDQNQSIFNQINEIKNIISNQSGKPYAFKTEDNIPKEFYFFPLQHLVDKGLKISEADSFSSLLEMFYSEKNNLDRITQSSKDMIHILSSVNKKLQSKLEIQKKEKLECGDKEKYQQTAILLQSNLYRIEKNSPYVMVDNFFDDNKPLKIVLDKEISAAANAQKYFNKYKKMCTADRMLDELIIETQNEIAYIESVIDNINRSTTRENLEQIKLELQTQGYLRQRRNSRATTNKDKKDKFTKVKSVDDLDILVGNNNVNNDRLTFKHANKNDIWFHTQKIPGAHVIVVSGGKEVPVTTIKQAAELAKMSSKARNESNVSVDYTAVKNVKKFKGARPGMVIYDNFKTIIVK